MKDLGQIIIEDDTRIPEIIEEDFNPIVPYEHSVNLRDADSFFNKNEFHLRVRDPFCYIPSKKQREILSVLSILYNKHLKEKKDEITKSFIHVPKKRLFDIAQSYENLSEDEALEMIALASARDWKNAWLEESKDYNRNLRDILIGTSLIILAAPIIINYIIKRQPLPMSPPNGIYASTWLAEITTLNFLRTKKDIALREIANSEVFINLY